MELSCCLFDSSQSLRWELTCYSFDILQYVFGMLYVFMQDCFMWLSINTDDQLLTNIVITLCYITNYLQVCLYLKSFREVTMKEVCPFLIAFKHTEHCFSLSRDHSFANVKVSMNTVSPQKIFRSKTICFPKK